METKICPSCDAEVPVVASRCKHCFHDFSEGPIKKSSGGLIGLLILLVALSVVGAGTFSYLYYFNSHKRVVVDAESQAIIISSTSASGPTTERIEFSSVEKLEYVLGGEKDTFEIVAVTSDGSRYITHRSSERPLKGQAEHLAAVMKKPLVEVRNITTFGD